MKNQTAIIILTSELEPISTNEMLQILRTELIDVEYKTSAPSTYYGIKEHIFVTNMEISRESEDNIRFSIERQPTSMLISF